MVVRKELKVIIELTEEEAAKLGGALVVEPVYEADVFLDDLGDQLIALVDSDDEIYDKIRDNCEELYGGENAKEK